jgi:hypothetical protein
MHSMSADIWKAVKLKLRNYEYYERGFDNFW